MLSLPHFSLILDQSRKFMAAFAAKSIVFAAFFAADRAFQGRFCVGNGFPDLGDLGQPFIDLGELIIQLSRVAVIAARWNGTR